MAPQLFIIIDKKNLQIQIFIAESIFCECKQERVRRVWKYQRGNQNP